VPKFLNKFQASFFYDYLKVGGRKEGVAGGAIAIASG